MQDQINNAFAALNADMLKRQTEWALARRTALREQRDAIFADRSIGTAEKYARLHGIAGGKGWYEVLANQNENGVREFVAKNIAATIAKRDTRIIAALEKKGVTELPEFKLEHAGMGHMGVFKVAGFVVTITTILAGGYNVQCLHQRTLVHVRAARRARGK